MTSDEFIILLAFVFAILFIGPVVLFIWLGWLNWLVNTATSIEKKLYKNRKNE